MGGISGGSRWGGVERERARAVVEKWISCILREVVNDSCI